MHAIDLRCNESDEPILVRREPRCCQCFEGFGIGAASGDCQGPVVVRLEELGSTGDDPINIVEIVVQAVRVNHPLPGACFLCGCDIDPEVGDGYIASSDEAVDSIRHEAGVGSDEIGLPQRSAGNSTVNDSLLGEHENVASPSCQDQRNAFAVGHSSHVPIVVGLVNVDDVRAIIGDDGPHLPDLVPQSEGIPHPERNCGVPAVIDRAVGDRQDVRKVMPDEGMEGSPVNAGTDDDEKLASLVVSHRCLPQCGM